VSTIYCATCKSNIKHETVDSSLDKEDGWKVSGIKIQGGFRDPATDYRTVQCSQCARVSTWDFSWTSFEPKDDGLMSFLSREVERLKALSIGVLEVIRELQNTVGQLQEQKNYLYQRLGTLRSRSSSESDTQVAVKLLESMGYEVLPPQRNLLEDSKEENAVKS